MEFVEIPVGILIMGDPKQSEALPQHRLEMAAFRIGRFPVTNVEFAAFVEDGGYTSPQYWTAMGWKAYQARPQAVPAFWRDPHFNAPRQPVVGISWYEAVAFCNWLTAREGKQFRLPSESEWEYAARGPASARTFPWGDIYERDRANTGEEGIHCTTPVDHYPGGVSPFGVWDLAGNVFEWTRSKWGMNWNECEFYYPYEANDGREDPDGSGARVMRGGSWFNRFSEARCAFRSRYLAGSKGSNIGFRVVCEGYR